MLPEWFFPIVFLTMMALCILMMAGRLGSGLCGGWCLGSKRLPRNRGGETVLRNEVDSQVAREGDRFPPVTPR
jgi:hypothetical protein